MAFCTSCGTTVIGAFCNQCGTPVKAVASSGTPGVPPGATLGSYETIGRALAEDCREGTDTTWEHGLLRHNSGEIGRLRERVRPILFA